MTPLPPLLEQILVLLEARSAAHGTKVRRRFSEGDARLAADATRAFEAYRRQGESTGRSLAFGVDAYIALIAQMEEERLSFLRTGKYANASFADVEREIYLNPARFEYHMHGLLFAQFFWPEQYVRFRFFADRIGAALAGKSRYLEIGGGHAVYLSEAIRQALSGVQFELLDISPSSMALAQGMTAGHAVTYRLANVFAHEPDEPYDFISIGEVIEHVEDPLALMIRVRSMLAPGGSVFVSTPVNAPTIDHIYVFRSADEIRALLRDAGFTIVSEVEHAAENASLAAARKHRLPVMYAAFLAVAEPQSPSALKD